MSGPAVTVLGLERRQQDPYDSCLCIASVKVGAVLVHDLSLYLRRDGRQHLGLPRRHTIGGGWRPVVELDPQLREQVLTAVQAAYAE